MTWAWFRKLIKALSLPAGSSDLALTGAQRYVPPLHVHVAYAAVHPRGRAWAELLERTLVGQEDALSVPQVDIPTFFWSAGDGTVPPDLDMDSSQRAVVLLLVDDVMVADWRSWTARQLDALRPDDLLLPVTITRHYANLHDQLNDRHCIRLDRIPKEEQERELVLRVVHAIARWFRGGRLRLFLSHAKGAGGGASGRELALATKEFLDQRPGDTFFDEIGIEGGDALSKALQTSLEDSVVVAFLTDLFPSRHWCAWEVLTAKQLRRPIVAVDALKTGCPAAMAYLGKTRTIRWPVDQNATPADAGLLAEIIMAGLLEILRVEHDERRLGNAKAVSTSPGRLVVSSFSPEPALLPDAREDGSALRVLHPDPPLPTCEASLLSRHRGDLTFVSATQQLAGGGSKPLAGQRVALSISDPEDLGSHGVTQLSLDRMWSRLALHLVTAGAEIGYGGDLRQQGYTQRLVELCARTADAGREWPDGVVHWFAAWPVAFTLDATARAGIPRAIALHALAAPHIAGCESDRTPASRDDSTREGRFELALAYSEMRARMTEACHARVLVGGRLRSTSPWPGVLEEFEKNVMASKPTFLIGGFGGMARCLARALRGETVTELSGAYQDTGPNRAAIREYTEEMAATGRFAALPESDLEERVDRLGTWGVPALANGLSAAENERLFVSRDATEIVSLVLRGLTASIGG